MRQTKARLEGRGGIAMNQHQVDARRLLKPALLDVAQKWRAMADEADIRDNPHLAFAERLRRSLGLSCPQ